MRNEKLGMANEGMHASGGAAVPPDGAICSANRDALIASTRRYAKMPAGLTMVAAHDGIRARHALLATVRRHCRPAGGLCLSLLHLTLLVLRSLSVLCDLCGQSVWSSTVYRPPASAVGFHARLSPLCELCALCG
jgi:hypothetical protein